MRYYHTLHAGPSEQQNVVVESIILHWHYADYAQRKRPFQSSTTEAFISFRKPVAPSVSKCASQFADAQNLAKNRQVLHISKRLIDLA